MRTIPYWTSCISDHPSSSPRPRWGACPSPAWSSECNHRLHLMTAAIRRRYTRMRALPATACALSAATESVLGRKAHLQVLLNKPLLKNVAISSANGLLWDVARYCKQERITVRQGVSILTLVQGPLVPSCILQCATHCTNAVTCEEGWEPPFFLMQETDGNCWILQSPLRANNLLTCAKHNASLVQLQCEPCDAPACSSRLLTRLNHRCCMAAANCFCDCAAATLLPAIAVKRCGLRSGLRASGSQQASGKRLVCQQRLQPYWNLMCTDQTVPTTAEP